MRTIAIGELLLANGHITAEQLEVALHTQKAHPGHLGEILVGLDFMTAHELARVVALQRKLPFVDLSISVPQKKALQAVPRELALYNTVLPLRISRGRLTVVTDDPAKSELAELLQEAAKLKVTFVVGERSQIAKSIELHYFEMENPINSRIAALVADAAAKREVDIESFLELLIQSAIKDRATDIHIRPQALASHVFYRVDGLLHHYYAFPSHIHRNVVSRCKILSEVDITQQRIPQEGGFAFHYLHQDYDIRLALIPTSLGENMALRILPKAEELYHLERLGFDLAQAESLERCLHKRSGIVLIVGPSGGGKTTTLFSALRRANILQRNVVTVEDPIEYQLSLVQQTNVNEIAGYTFDESLSHLVRQDADIIVIGEIRDQGTAMAAVRSALSGHLVLSTMTANDVQGALARLMDFGVKSYMLSFGLLAVLYQQLLRRLCDSCKRPVKVSRQELLARGFDSEALAAIASKVVTLYEAAGCEHCQQTGYRGRIAIAELVEMNDELRALLDKGKIVVETAALLKRGEGTIRHDAQEKVLTGVTSLEEVLRVLS